MVFTNQNYSGGGNSQEGAGVLVALGAIGLAGWSVVALFAISAAVSVLIGAYVIFAAILMFAADKAWEASGWIRFLLGVSILIALLITPFCFVGRTGWYHWMGGAVAGLYIVALAIGLWRVLGAWLKFLAAVCAAALVAAFVVLPAPEAASSENEDDTWHVQLTVVDDRDRPIEGVVAQCSTIMAWERGRPFKFRMTTLQDTDERGQATLTLSAETRFKLALCGATLPASPSEDGYALRSGVVANPFRGGTFPLTIVLDRRLPAGSSPDGLPPDYASYVCWGCP